MGAVWLAHDEVLGREVALKRIGLVPGADTTDLARAEREARLAARLSHPHVVAVFNLVVDDDAQWLVMEYVEGTTMSQLVREEGPLTPDQAAPLLWQAADGLVAAHQAGIVHRDVKPSNILVDRRRRVKITDFGIAHVTADPSLTQTGLVTGSPAYLAPEVAAGQRGDASSDVWSLGATVFHMLSGRPPYDMGDHLLGGLYRIVNEEPPRLPDAGWMAPLLEATMAKDPAQRWTMAEVRDFLGGPTERTVPIRPVAPAPVLAPTPPSGRSRDRRPLLVLAGLAAAAVVGVVLLALLPDGDAPSGRAEASGPASPAGSSTASAQAPSEESTPAPTAAGMEAFVRDYVAAVSTDPDTAWTMLTPKFQRESGGLENYRDFWSDVGNGEVLEVTADPQSLVVSYRVRFDNFGTGERPTVLSLAYDGSGYRIDGEQTEGFVPAG